MEVSGVRSSWLTLAMKFTAGGFRGLDAGDLVQHGERAAGGHGGGVDLEDAPLGKANWRGRSAPRASSKAERTQASSQGFAHRVNQRRPT